MPVLETSRLDLFGLTSGSKGLEVRGIISVVLGWPDYLFSLYVKSLGPQLHQTRFVLGLSLIHI